MERNQETTDKILDPNRGDTSLPDRPALPADEALQPPAPPERIVTAIGGTATDLAPAVPTDHMPTRGVRQRDAAPDVVADERSIAISIYVERAISGLGPVATLRRSSELNDALYDGLDELNLPIGELKAALRQDARVQAVTRPKPDGSEMIMYYRVFPNGTESPDAQAVLELESAFNEALAAIDASWNKKKFSAQEYREHCVQSAAAMPQVARLLELPGAQQMLNLLASQKVEARLAADAELRAHKYKLLRELLEKQNHSMAHTINSATRWARGRIRLLDETSYSEVRARVEDMLEAAAADEANGRVHALPHERYLILGSGEVSQLERYLGVSAHLDEAMLQARDVQNQPHKDAVLAILESMLTSDDGPGLTREERAMAVRLLYSHPWWSRKGDKIVLPRPQEASSVTLTPKAASSKQKAKFASPAEHAAAKVAAIVMGEGYVSITAERCASLLRSLRSDLSGEFDEEAVIAHSPTTPLLRQEQTILPPSISNWLKRTPLTAVVCWN